MLNVSMAGLDGLEACRALRSRGVSRNLAGRRSTRRAAYRLDNRCTQLGVLGSHHHHEFSRELDMPVAQNALALAGGSPRQRLALGATTAAVLMLTVACSGSGGTTSSGAPSGTVSGAASGGPGGPGGGAGGGGGAAVPPCNKVTAVPSAAPASAIPAFSDDATVTSAVAKAQAFLGTLSAAQKATVMNAYTDLAKKQCSWSNYPDDNFTGRLGLKLGDLSATQKAAALAAVQAVMSPEGYTQVTNEMLADDQLGKQEDIYGQANYHIVMYGQPSADSPWTMQFGGHHLAIHVSVGGGALSVSPHFSGTQPVSFELNGKTIKPLGVDAGDIFGLFGSLTAEQTTKAKLAGQFRDLVMGPGTDTGYPKQEGLAYTALNTAQQAAVKKVIADWVADAAPELADPLLKIYYSQLDQTVIGYASSTSADSGDAYLRIDGPRVWIEWLNTSAAGGLHYHTLYRDKALDYGTGLG